MNDYATSRNKTPYTPTNRNDCRCTHIILPPPKIHRRMSSAQLESIFQVSDAHLVPKYEIVTVQHHGSAHSGHHVNKRDTNHHRKVDFSKSAYFSDAKNADGGRTASTAAAFDLNGLSEHNVSLSAFGTVYNLTLRPTQGLFKEGVSALRMWTVSSEANATNGLNYQLVEEEEVSASDTSCSHDLWSVSLEYSVHTISQIQLHIGQTRCRVAWTLALL